MRVEDITVVVGVDAVTIQQLAVSLPTWKKNRPELWQMPWLFAVDRNAERTPDFEFALRSVPNATWMYWPPCEVAYETQRERMVTAHVFVPAIYAKTQWSLKIDTDALALDSRPWLQDEWFDADSDGRHNAIIASPWGYTKAKGGGGTISQWAESLESWGDQIVGGLKRLDLAGAITMNDNKIVMPRIASWLSFYHVPWLRLLAAELGRTLQPYRLPVPSQDTVCWYFAARRCDRIHRTNMKRCGWTNVPHLDNLRAKAAEVMGR